MIATSGFLTALECTKFDFGPGPDGGAYNAPQANVGRYHRLCATVSTVKKYRGTR